MPLFTNARGHLKPISEVRFKEGNLQKTVESNLKEIFDLEFVRSEFTVPNSGFRIDTLAFDNTNKSFVIIEYKRQRDLNVIDQGYAYLGQLVGRKELFLVEYNEIMGSSLKRSSIDWTGSRVIFVSPDFTKYQKSMNLRGLPIEMWEAKEFEHDLYSFTKLESPEGSESIATLAGKSQLVRKVNKEVKAREEEDFLSGKPENIRDLYEDLRDRIRALGSDVKVKPTKYFIFFGAKTHFAYVEIQKSKLKLLIMHPPGELQDPEKKARDITHTGHWGTATYDMGIRNTEELGYVMRLVKQAYEKHR